jgi:hypothetical protein
VEADAAAGGGARVVDDRAPMHPAIATTPGRRVRSVPAHVRKTIDDGTANLPPDLAAVPTNCFRADPTGTCSRAKHGRVRGLGLDRETLVLVCLAALVALVGMPPKISATSKINDALQPGA